MSKLINVEFQRNAVPVRIVGYSHAKYPIPSLSLLIKLSEVLAGTGLIFLAPIQRISRRCSYMQVGSMDAEVHPECGLGRVWLN